MPQASQPLPPTPPCPSCGQPLSEPGAPCLECAETRPDTAPPRSPARLLKQIAGYRILRELGSGGMGTVYEAHDARMDRRVALKVMSRRLAASSRAVDRFAREAWIAGRLNHPNLVKVYDRGEWEDLSFYSMELVDGGSLADVIQNLRRSGRDPGWGQEFGSRDYVQWATRQVIAAARGLDYAHRQRVVHRDVKPMNLLLSREFGTVKVADFGLAVDTGAARMTSDGKVLGTLIYMSPEQILGKVDEVDARTDIYALGVTLFELLTLEFPYTAGTQQLYADAVLSSDVRSVSRLNARVGRDLEIVIRKALEKEKGDRYPTVGAFADDLENVLQYRPILARPPGLPEKAAKWARRRPMHAILAGLLAAGIPTLAFLTHRTVQHRILLKRERLEELEREVRLLRQADRHGELVRRTSEILDIDPGDPMALRTRGVSYTRLARAARDPRAAADLAEKGLADISALVERLPDRSWPYRLKAWALSELGRVEEADQATALAARRESADPTDDDLYYGSLLAYGAGDFARAASLASAAAVKNPGRRETIALRGEAYAKLGEIQKAINDYRVVLALEPDNPLNYYYLGRLLFQAGNFEEGADLYRRSLEMANAGSMTSTHHYLSDMHLELGRRAALAGDPAAALDHLVSAEKYARAGLERDPDYPPYHVKLAVSLTERYRLNPGSDPALVGEAVAHYEQAIANLRLAGREEEQEAHESALVGRCDALIQLGELERALAACLEVARVYPDAINSHYNLAGVYALTGRRDEAFRSLEKGFSLGDRDWEYLAADRWFETLRGDPRFKALIERMKKG